MAERICTRARTRPPTSAWLPAASALLLWLSCGTVAGLSADPTPIPKPIAPAMPEQAQGPNPAQPTLTTADNSGEVEDPSTAAPVRLRSGPQRLAYEGLIHRDEDRDTATAVWTPDLQTAVRGFLTRPDRAQTREAHPNPATTPRIALHGALLERDLQLSSGNSLQLNGAWISGRQLDEDLDYRSAAPVSDAWSIGAKALLLDKRLHTAAEYAGSSRHDQYATQDDRAYKTSAEWRIDQDHRSWRIGSEYSWVGPGFASPANPALGRDRLRWRRHGALQLDDWRFQLSLDSSSNNLQQNPTMPTSASEKWEFSTHWTPAPNLFPAGWGLPSVRLLTTRSLRETDTGLGPTSMTHSTRLGLETAFKTEPRQWGGKFDTVVTRAAAADNLSPGIRTTRLDLYADHRSDPLLAMRADLSWQHRHDPGGHTDERRWLARLRSARLALAGGLDADLDLNLLHKTGPSWPHDARGLKIGARLAWTLQPPRSDQSGLALILSGQLRNGDFPATGQAAHDDTRILLSLSSSNPVAGW